MTDLEKKIKAGWDAFNTGTSMPKECLDYQLALISSTMQEIIPEKSAHTLTAKVHFDKSDYAYPCCERVQSYNAAIAQMEQNAKELGLGL